MVCVREKKDIHRPPPKYKPAGVYLSLVLNYGGRFVESNYIGGSVMIVDFVVAKQLSLKSLKNSIQEWLVCDGDMRIYIILDKVVKLMSSDEQMIEYCRKCLGLRQVVFYVEEGERVADTLGTQFVTIENVVTKGKEKVGSSGAEGYESEDLCDSDYNMNEESDDDDLLFDTYVSPEVDGKVMDESDSEPDVDIVYTDINDFDEHKVSDGEKDDESYPVFNNEVIFQPESELGMLFSSRDTFQKAIQSAAIRSKRTLTMIKSAPTRTYVKCDNHDCPWVIHLNKVIGEESYPIRKYVSKHECDEGYHVKNVKSPWVCDRFIDKIATDRKRKVSVFRADAIKELGVEISREQAYRAKKLALKKLEGDPNEQYGKLFDYAEEVRRTNPGSTVIVGSLDDGNGQPRFERFYMCLGAVKKGFKIGCRPIIGLDGCHLKGCVQGILLSAVGVDANNCIYPIAFAVVNRETRETWEWFLAVLKQDLELHEKGFYTFMSDKQKGLIQAMGDIFPDAPHRFCVRHLNENFKVAGFRGLSFKQALWRAAQSATVPEWKKRMQELKNLNEAAWAWLDAKPAHQWSKSHFSDISKCDMLLNNGCEVFNSTILEAREMPILTMIEWIRVWLMIRFQRHRDLSTLRWNGRICPRIKKILQKHSERVGDCIPIKCDNTHYEIQCNDGGQFVVDLELMSCSCRLWDLSGIPCTHAISAINHQRLNKEDFVNECYTVETFKRTYAETIKGMNGDKLWGESMYIPHLPPLMQKGKGKNSSARKKAPDEKAEKLLKAKTKLRRRQTTIKCSGCGVQGHNSATCGRDKNPKGGSGSGSQQEQPEEQSLGGSMLPPQNSELYDGDEEQDPQDDALTQQSQASSSNSHRVPAPSMLQQLHQGKFQTHGKKTVSLAQLQARKSRKKK